MVIAVFILATNAAMAAFFFIGVSDESKNSSKYSLKNFSRYSHKSLSLSLIRSNLQFSGSQVLTQKTNESGLEVNSMMQYNRGNTTYVFPYTFKVHVPKFKTPSPPPGN